MAHHLLLPATATLALFLIFLSPLTSTATNPPVLDIDGNPLEVGSEYYVLSSGWGAAGRGGLTYTTLSGFSLDCPHLVAQYSASFWMQKGLPVHFSPSDSSTKEINEGSDVNIAFAFRPNPCRDTGVWQVSHDINNAEPGVSYITLSGLPGHSSPNSDGNWFKLEPVTNMDRVYKIVTCLDGEDCKQLSGTTPAVFNGLNFLGLIPVDEPLPFFGYVFQKVSNDDHRKNNIIKRITH